MGLYFSRALKYFLKLVIVIAVVLGVLAALGMLNTQGTSLLETLIYSWRGGVLAGAIVLFSFLYPKISFDTVDVRGDVATNRDDVVNAFANYGYSLDKEKNGVMTFRANSRLRRLLWQFDDAVTVRQENRYIRIEGTKKVVPRVRLRLNAYLSR